MIVPGIVLEIVLATISIVTVVALAAVGIHWIINGNPCPEKRTRWVRFQEIIGNSILLMFVLPVVLVGGCCLLKNLLYAFDDEGWLVLNVFLAICKTYYYHARAMLRLMVVVIKIALRWLGLFSPIEEPPEQFVVKTQSQ